MSIHYLKVKLVVFLKYREYFKLILANIWNIRHVSNWKSKMRSRKGYTIRKVNTSHDLQMYISRFSEIIKILLYNPKANISNLIKRIESKNYLIRDAKLAKLPLSLFLQIPLQSFDSSMFEPARQQVISYESSSIAQNHFFITEFFIVLFMVNLCQARI